MVQFFRPSSTIPGSCGPAHVEEIVGAVGLELPPEYFRRLVVVKAKLKTALGGPVYEQDR